MLSHYCHIYEKKEDPMTPPKQKLHHTLNSLGLHKFLMNLVRALQAPDLKIELNEVSVKWKIDYVN